MVYKIRKIWNLITTILVGIALVLALLLVGVRLTGLQIYMVLSGSMEPTYQTGSVIYVKEAEPSKLEAGDVITFQLNGGAVVATHRIVEVVADEENPDVIRFRTKGDANDQADGGLVEAGQVIGTPIFTIPYLGYFVNYIQNPPGMYVAIAAAAFLLLLILLPDLLFGDKDKK